MLSPYSTSLLELPNIKLPWSVIYLGKYDGSSCEIINILKFKLLKSLRDAFITIFINLLLWFTDTTDMCKSLTFDCWKSNYLKGACAMNVCITAVKLNVFQCSLSSPYRKTMDFFTNMLGPVCAVEMALKLAG